VKSRELGAIVTIAAVAGGLGCGAGTAGAPNITWQAASTPMGATVEHLQWDSIGRDTLLITASGRNAFLVLSLSAPTPLSPGTFQCGQTVDDRMVAISFTASSARAEAADSCTLVLTQVGKTPEVPILGTFEATFPRPDGSRLTFTNGRIEIALHGAQ
jgi:hypothetical protein